MNTKNIFIFIILFIFIFFVSTTFIYSVDSDSSVDNNENYDLLQFVNIVILILNVFISGANLYSNYNSQKRNINLQFNYNLINKKIDLFQSIINDIIPLQSAKFKYSKFDFSGYRTFDHSHKDNIDQSYNMFKSLNDNISKIKHYLTEDELNPINYLMDLIVYHRAIKIELNSLINLSDRIKINSSHFNKSEELHHLSAKLLSLINFIETCKPHYNDRLNQGLNNNELNIIGTYTASIKFINEVLSNLNFYYKYFSIICNAEYIDPNDLDADLKIKEDLFEKYFSYLDTFDALNSVIFNLHLNSIFDLISYMIELLNSKINFLANSEIN